MLRLALWYVFWIGIVLALPLSAAAWQDTIAIDQATAHLSKGEPRQAVEVIEAALPGAGGEERSRLLAKLHQAYEQALKLARSEQKPIEVEHYTENLKILDRKKNLPRPPASPEPIVEPEKVAAPPSPAPEARTTLPALPAADASKAKELAPGLATRNARSGADPVADPLVEKQAAPPAPSTAPPAKPKLAAADTLAAADDAFRAKRYAEAGRLYAKVAARKQLPESREDAWGYCRALEVVGRINAGPRNAEEWALIRREVELLRQLKHNPKNWSAEYLSNLIAERTGPTRKANSRKVVFRGASPDDQPAPASSPSSGKPKTAAATAAPRSPIPRSASAPAPARSDRIGQPGAPINNWRVWDTPSFRILHADDALAETVARVCETTRTTQMRHWFGRASSAEWTPRCDVYLYPTPAQFHQMTDQPEESPGFSTMGVNEGRVVARRMNLRADHPKLLMAILPHEITHVVLADLFTSDQIPRWADEGMAVLSEPTGEQQLRAVELAEPLETGRLFRLQDLMVMDYPDGRYWGLYYAQSVSLTRFIVSQGTPAQFVQFVRDSQRNGVEAELKRTYRIDGFADLEKRWRAHARGVSTALASVGDGSPTAVQEKPRGR
jgi:hypothetical protein